MPNTKETATSPARELLGRKDSGKGPRPLHPLDYLAFAILQGFESDVEVCLEAIENLHRDFVDWNEIRVARVQEITRSLKGVASAEDCARRLKEEYNGFFDKKGALDFEFLAMGKPAETRRTLVQLLPNLTKGSVAFLLYEFCPGASLPISDGGLKAARKDGIVGKNADRNLLSRVLADSLTPAEASRLTQYWELEGSGNPFGEPPRKETSATGKKGKKSQPKTVGKAKG